MNTLKMIAEIKMVCAALDSEKKELTARLKEIDDDLTGYHMAIDSLELTLHNRKKEEQKPAGDPEPAKPFGKKTVLSHGGKSMTVNQWAAELKMTAGGILYRLNNGWSVDDALSSPRAPGVSMKPNRKKPVTKIKKVCMYNPMGCQIRQYMGVKDAAANLHVSTQVIEKTISCVSKADQIAAKGYYIAYEA